MSTIEIKVPDIGDFHDVPVLDCLSPLGFTPVDRARLGFVEVKIQNELEAFRERKAQQRASVVDAEVVSDF